jgi:GWxTD domain-containing protein
MLKLSVNRSSQSFQRFQLIVSLSLAVILVLVSVGAHAEQNRKEKLPKFYSQWLNRDVTYIITNQERKAFLKLTTNDERDAFIKNFWEIRNPTPGSPTNSYEDEIYERIAYADAHFSIGSGEEGWRTDRGRTYITLGKPQQIQRYYGAPNLRPIEIWFYSNLNPSLPPFFYILFYQRDNIGDFRYYSPSLDGPDKLVSGMEAINDPQAALQIIQSSVGPEVARIAQTLIPGEPLDPNGRIGLQSDVMLSVLHNLANQPYNVDALNRRRELSETVTSRMILDTKNLNILLLPVRDGRGITRLDYAVRLGSPGDLTLEQRPDGRYGYTIEVRIVVSTPEKKVIFTQQKSVSGILDHQHMEEIKHRLFGYEGILPLPPGKYHLDFLVTDWTQKVAYHAQRDVEIPASTANTFVIPFILPFSSVEPVNAASADRTPFAMAGLRFKPLVTSPLALTQADDLNIAYQIWAPPGNPAAIDGQNLTVQYALGKPALTGTATVMKDTVNMGQFTSFGSLVNGKKIPLANQPDGSYILTVSVSHPGTPQKAYSSLALDITSEPPDTRPWDVDEPGIETDEAKGILDQERASSYLAEDQPTQARLWFRLALSKDHSDDVARARLVQAYYNLNAYSAVVSLFQDAGITRNTDSSTIAQIAESLSKTGSSSKAVSLLQNTIHSRPEDGPLYLALADCYQAMGKQQDAIEMSRKGKSLLTSSDTQK